MGSKKECPIFEKKDFSCLTEPVDFHVDVGDELEIVSFSKLKRAPSWDGTYTELRKPKGQSPMLKFLSSTGDPERWVTIEEAATHNPNAAIDFLLEELKKKKRSQKAKQ